MCLFSYCFRYALNLEVTFIPVLIAIALSSMAAYSFAQMEYKGRDLIFLLYISMMMVPNQILFVPEMYPFL